MALPGKYNWTVRVRWLRGLTSNLLTKNLAPCGTDGRLLLSGFQLVVTLTLDWVIWHTVVHQSLTSIYTPNFIEIGKTICGRTYLLMDISPSNVIRSTRRSWSRNGGSWRWIADWSKWSGAHPDCRCVPPVILPSTIKSRKSFLLAPAPGWSPKKGCKRLQCGGVKLYVLSG